MDNDADSLKKYKSAYIIYSIEQRKNVKELNPKVDNREATRIIADNWKRLSIEEKEKYKKIENEEKEKFLSLKKEKKYVYKKTKTKKPTRHRTAYMFYISKNKDCLKGISKYKNIENIKILCEKWRRMTDVQKLPYIQMAQNDKERFNKEWDAYFHKYIKTTSKGKNKNEKENEKFINFIKDSKRLSFDLINDKNLKKNHKLDKIKENKLQEIFIKQETHIESELIKPFVFNIEKSYKKFKRNNKIKLGENQEDCLNEESDDFDIELDEIEENNENNKF